MPQPISQILTVAQMRAAEQALIDGGVSVDELMQRAGVGAAEWVWRLAAHRPVTVLCGPGNNGGDGYVIAEALRGRGGEVRVVAPVEPKTAAAKVARGLYRGTIGEAPGDGQVLVDCLFGSGLTRPLDPTLLGVLEGLCSSHNQLVAIDVPSGVESDTGVQLNEGLPNFDLTIALGAWKFAHWLMPASAAMGDRRLVEIGIGAVDGAARLLERPRFQAPAPTVHKYTRGLLAVVSGAMPGAAVLAAGAAQRAGAGYVKVLGDGAVPADLVADRSPLSQALADPRIAALLIGPGLGRDPVAVERLRAVLALDRAAVLDADALMLLELAMQAGRRHPLIVTPHDGELAQLLKAFGLAENGAKPERVAALARRGNMIVVAKGADTVIAGPDGALTICPAASTWLSTAGTGDVLAGAIASRLACRVEPFTAACQGVWLHGEAARLLSPAFTAGELALAIGDAYAAAL